MKKLIPCASLVLLTALGLSACDSGGVPVRLRIDEFTLDLEMDQMVEASLQEFRALGLFPPETPYLPEIWPDSLPEVRYRMNLDAPPIPVDLTPEPGSEEEEKYEDIGAAAGVVQDIELNRLVVRIEASSINVALPGMRLQVADDKEADPEDRLAWRTVGTIPGVDPGFVGDIEFDFVPGGESFLNAQMTDEDKEFAVRLKGNLEIDTTQDDRLPAGRARIRLIVVATFFIDPAGAL